MTANEQVLPMVWHLKNQKMSFIMKSNSKQKVEDLTSSHTIGNTPVMGSTGYSLEQFPKNKDIVNLSDEQKFIRQNLKKYVYKDKFTCVKCGKEQPIQEFYVADINTGRRKKSCRDCQMKAADVIEIGKFRFAKKILDKGFRRCSVCKEIKPITDYTKSKTGYRGYSNNCYECSNKLHGEYLKKQQEEIGLFYIKQYGLRKGISEFTNEIIEQLKTEIIENRKPKYFIDGLEFVTVADFARYIEVKYGLPVTMTIKRIYEGKTEEQCKMTESEMRSIAYTKGKIKVTDTVTGEVFWFNNTNDEKLTKMFSRSAITRGIKTGEKTRITGLSKYKNPCIITRI